MNRHRLILGGARSGKSTYAEKCVNDIALNLSLEKMYVATATSSDREMANRIEMHQRRRDGQWELLETPLDLSQSIQAIDKHYVVLIDCLTLWLNNVIFDLGDQATDDQVHGKVSELLNAIRSARCHLVIVSNEVGMGIVPLGKVTRLFVDHAGWMNQKVATLCDDVTFVAAGLPLSLKASDF